MYVSDEKLKESQGRCLYIVAFSISTRREIDLQLTNRSRWRYDIQIQFNLPDSLSALQFRATNLSSWCLIVALLGPSGSSAVVSVPDFSQGL